ncbi:phage/conjugal plasmid C-4 type zinc finger protein, TraR family [compost metagenome]
MDIADIANDNLLLQLEQHLAARQPAEGVSAEDCEDCGDPIPVARRLALAGRGCVRCIECQGQAERRAAHG